jgi:hypothetical protein
VKIPVRKTPHLPAPRKAAGLRARLAESEDTLRAIRAGEVDSLLVTGTHGSRVFTLSHRYFGKRSSHPYLQEGYNR